MCNQWWIQRGDEGDASPHAGIEKFFYPLKILPVTILLAN